jgi:hypothetical protein
MLAGGASDPYPNEASAPRPTPMNTDFIHSLQLLAATKLTPQTLMAVGAAVTVIVSMITFSNWRAGVKIAFVVVLFEGAIRKWVMPGAQELAEARRHGSQ